jgi:hypothetical protein
MGEPYTGPTITHQGIEYIGEVTRCWSRWTDGRVTHQDTRTVWREVRLGDRVMQMPTYEFVGIGMDERLRPPPGLKWIDTVAVRREIEAGRAGGAP